MSPPDKNYKLFRAALAFGMLAILDPFLRRAKLVF